MARSFGNVQDFHWMTAAGTTLDTDRARTSAIDYTHPTNLHSETCPEHFQVIELESRMRLPQEYFHVRHEECVASMLTTL